MGRRAETWRVYNDINNTTNMIVGIVKISAGLKALEEFREATDETAAVTQFCNEHTPQLLESDYLGVNADLIDLQKNWGWDFLEATPVLKEVIIIVSRPMPVNANESNDYYQFREYQREILDAKTWANLSVDERDFMIELDLKETSVSDAQDGANKVTHLISTGQATTTEESRIVIVNAWAAHHVLDIESCTARAKALKLYIEIGTYLSKADAIDLFETINNLYVGFRDQAIKGTLDGSGTGLFNYIESTVGTVYEFAGLASKGYTMQNGDLDMANFVAALMRILREGRYTLN